VGEGGDLRKDPGNHRIDRRKRRRHNRKGGKTLDIKSVFRGKKQNKKEKKWVAEEETGGKSNTGKTTAGFKKKKKTLGGHVPQN